VQNSNSLEWHEDLPFAVNTSMKELSIEMHILTNTGYNKVGSASLDLRKVSKRAGTLDIQLRLLQKGPCFTSLLLHPHP